MSSALSWELFKPSSHLKAAGNAAVSLFMLMLPTSYRAASHNDLGSWIFLHRPSLKHQHQLNSIAKWTSTNNTDTATLINHNRGIISLLILRTTLQSGFLLVPQSPPIIKELRLRPLVHIRLKILALLLFLLLAIEVISTLKSSVSTLQTITPANFLSKANSAFKRTLCSSSYETQRSPRT